MTEHSKSDDDVMPLDEIRLTGLQVRASHGVMPHEQIVPQTFIVDMAAKVDLFTPSMSDDLSHTIDYGQLAEMIANIVRDEPVRLIEALAGTIADEIMGSYESIHAVAITVHKPQAPISELVSDVSVTVNRVRDAYTSRIW
ncbi:dihydroneopterin aldolase [Stomatohabitans albus]|uniref:dihydroneopterin aldolase n=1 Tax=Stomatohabitans albus TaxID=3110766 RepID=UPI00300C4813